MKTKIALFVLVVTGIVHFGCVSNPSGSSSQSNPNSEGFSSGDHPTTTIHKITPQLPQYNRDGSLTLFTTKNIAFKIMPMTNARGSLAGRGALDRSPDEFNALIKQYEEQLAANPQDYDACIALAGLYLDRGNPGDADQAVKYSDRALTIRKNDSDALYARALAYSEKGDGASRAKALNDLEQVLQSNQQSTIGVYYVMGMIHYRDEKIDKAIEAFEKVKAIDPAFVDTNEILEVLYKRKK